MIFETSKIVSAATGRLVCEIDGVYEILNFLTGDTLFTHQLPRAVRECKPILTEQFPWIADLDTEKCTRETWKEWLADIEAEQGKEHNVLIALPLDVCSHRDPLQELEEMGGVGKTIVVEAQ